MAFQETKRYCKLREKALARSFWRTRFGRGYGPFVRQKLDGDDNDDDDDDEEEEEEDDDTVHIIQNVLHAWIVEAYIVFPCLVEIELVLTVHQGSAVDDYYYVDQHYFEFELYH